MFRIAFSSLRGMTSRLAQEILARCGTEEQFFALPERTLGAMMGFSSKLFDRAYRDEVMEAARREAAFVESNAIRPLYFTADDYPQRLSGCDDAPAMLYSLVDCELNRRPVVAVVGTRHVTVYGQQLTRDIISGLAAQMSVKPVIVSGLAYGVDVAAHRAALDAGLPTVAVLAHGLNTIYPAQHRSVAAEMVRSGGMLVTEYKSSDAIHKGNFLARNRIVAGLCDCLIVIESAAKGGALVTARLASGYGRDVMAVPGRAADKYSEGCNRLIKSNVAHLIESAADVMEIMNWPAVEREGEIRSLFVEYSPEEEAVIAALRDCDGASFSQILARVHLPTARLMGLLVDMEFKDYLHALPGGNYKLKI